MLCTCTLIYLEFGSFVYKNFIDNYEQMHMNVTLSFSEGVRNAC